MSKHTTLDQLEMLARRTKTEIDKVDAKVDTISGKVDGLVATGGEPNVLTAVKVDGTALEIADKAVDIGASISAAVAKADHLKRKKVENLEAIDASAEDAAQYIYMVPKTGSDEDDLYDEYMILDGKVEYVGNTKVNLSGNRESEHLACCFDAYCKRLLKNEVIDTIRGEKRMGQREVTFSDLTRAERNQLQYIDHCAPDRRVFPLLGMEIEVLDADLVRALAELPTDRRVIILLYYFLEMRDEEIGTRLGLSRPAVQRRRTSTLDMLRKILEE